MTRITKVAFMVFIFVILFVMHLRIEYLESIPIYTDFNVNGSVVHLVNWNLTSYQVRELLPYIISEEIVYPTEPGFWKIRLMSEKERRKFVLCSHHFVIRMDNSIEEIMCDSEGNKIINEIRLLPSHIEKKIAEGRKLILIRYPRLKYIRDLWIKLYKPKSSHYLRET